MESSSMPMSSEDTANVEVAVTNQINETVGITTTTEEEHVETEDVMPVMAAEPYDHATEATMRSMSAASAQLHQEEAMDQVSDLVRLESRSHLRNKSTMLERFSSIDTSNLETMLSGGLDRFYGKYKNAWKKHNLSFPTPEIVFDNLSYTVRMSTEPSASKGSIGGFVRAVAQPWRKLKTIKKTILHPMSGVIRPGSMTLVLANPGAGKSTFLKALAGKLGNRPGLKGRIAYSGLPADEIQISKLVGLVDQQDNHLPTLTVRETIQFADRCINGPPENQPAKLREVARLRTDLCLHILGLTKCADTVVGDALLRGVSGGERKRVTLGEMIVGGQSVFLCDEVSTGLDSAATFDIMKSLKSWSSTLGGSAVVALLQPPPEVVELFDDVIILTEGRLVYHGPTKEMLPYLNSLGFVCPPHVDPAEFAVDVVSGRGAQFLKSRQSVGGTQLPSLQVRPSVVSVSPPPSGPTTKPPRRAHQFEEAFHRSAIYATTHSTIEAGRHTSRQAAPEEGALQAVHHLIAKSEMQRQPTFGTSFLSGTALLLTRQAKIWMRDRALVFGKLIEAVLVGLLLGIIYLDANPGIYMRMLFFTIAIFQRQAWQLITISFQVRNVFYKQRTRNFFRTSSYTLAESIVQIPLNVLVSLVLCVIFYFMSGLSRTAGAFGTFYAIIVCFQHAIGAYFALLASLAPNITIAQALASLSVSFFLLFSGNIILPNLIPDYWVWMYWFNPLAWTLRSVLLNEFSDTTKYTPTTRKQYIDRFQVKDDPAFVWIGILVLIAYYVLFTLVNTLAMHYVRYEVTSTASSTPDALDDSYPEHETTTTTQGPSYRDSVAPPQTGGTIANSAPVPGTDVGATGATSSVVVDVPQGKAPTFNPAYLVVKELEYFVPNPQDTKQELQLLHNVNAYFTPGKMTALMGSSGAGKTTFMDVLAGRKTGGRITGQILVNGEPKDPRTFSRIAGYCEQMDIHSGGTTIKEALEFSAQLRLPSDTTVEARDEIVRSTMELLELHPIASELVRNCSIEQKKRITIGVEVVANPSILFLDEPTSGLDARSASFVMKGVLSIARTGRTVLCTIHQPSMQIFELFDSLLLLQKGGHMAYFGDLGANSKLLLQYFAGIPGTAPMPALYNPATYMLEVIGAGIGRGQARDYSVEYTKSALCAANLAQVETLAHGEQLTKFSSLGLQPMATGFAVQFRMCRRKMRWMYWRNPQYNLMRMVAFPIYAAIFGTTFYQLEITAPAHANSHVGLLYNSLDFIGVINLMTVLDIVTTERAVYYRERMSNYYGPLPYALSLWLAEIPYLIYVSLLFINVEYWLVGWYANAQSFFLFWFVFFLHIAICTSVGQLMSVLMPNIKVANVGVGALSVLFNLFSGFLMPHKDMRGFYKWIKYLVPTSYSLEALAGIELARCGPKEPTTAHGCNLLTVPGSPPTTQRLKDFIFGAFGFQYEDLTTNIVVLIGMWLLLQIAIYLTLRFVSHLKR